MVSGPLDAAGEENLAACREYFEHHGTLAAPRTATALDKPVGQWLSNQRRPGALVSRPDRVEAFAETGGAQLADLLPGVTIHGLDVGRWLERQRQNDRLRPLPRAPPDPSAPAAHRPRAEHPAGLAAALRGLPAVLFVLADTGERAARQRIRDLQGIADAYPLVARMLMTVKAGAARLADLEQQGTSAAVWHTLSDHTRPLRGAWQL